MKIEYLNEFLVLARCLNYVVASDMLFLSQSTLTRHIQALEEFYGVLLFDRSTRKMTLTREGKMLIPYAKAIMNKYNEYIAGAGTRGESNNAFAFSDQYTSSEQYLISTM